MDWRLEQLLASDYLKAVRFQWLRYRTYRPGWDHDHCSGCFAKFAEEEDGSGEPVLRAGYTTCEDYPKGAEYHWVCPECWILAREPMGWTEVSCDEEGLPRPN